eukprot:TRINITY_DN27606_c0_g1_i1.p1 TRINITY_DN27606_c0_g1~~TRINITY_DN27606_c0_g1_i1.p1  ORF type:complete len:474 (-),score=126.28 TRINITY_DN27606_c0_g1_i1:40-1461(-)
MCIRDSINAEYGGGKRRGMAGWVEDQGSRVRVMVFSMTLYAHHHVEESMDVLQRVAQQIQARGDQIRDGMVQSVAHRRVFEYDFPAAYFDSAGYFQIAIAPSESEHEYFSGELHAFCHELKLLAAAHNSSKDSTLAMDAQNLPYVCALDSCGDLAAGMRSQRELALWVGFYEAFREGPAPSGARGGVFMSPLESDEGEGSEWPDELVEAYASGNVLIHRGEVLLIGETALYLRAPQKYSARWLGAVIHVKTMVYALCMVKAEMDRIFRVTHRREEGKRRAMRDRLRRLSSELPLARALVDVVSRLTGEYEWTQLINCDIQNKRVIKRAAEVFQIQILSDMVNTRMGELVSQVKHAQEETKHTLHKEQKEQLQLLALLSKINAVVAVANGLNNVVKRVSSWSEQAHVQRASEMVLTGAKHANQALNQAGRAAKTVGDSWLHKLRSVSYTHLRAHETPEHLVCRLLLEKKKKMQV